MSNIITDKKRNSLILVHIHRIEIISSVVGMRALQLDSYNESQISHP